MPIVVLFMCHCYIACITVFLNEINGDGDGDDSDRVKRCITW